MNCTRKASKLCAPYETLILKASPNPVYGKNVSRGTGSCHQKQPDDLLLDPPIKDPMLPLNIATLETSLQQTRP